MPKNTGRNLPALPAFTNESDLVEQVNDRLRRIGVQQQQPVGGSAPVPVVGGGGVLPVTTTPPGDGSVTIDGVPVVFTTPVPTRTITITAATSANPTVLTSVAHGMTTGTPVGISGATGSWAGINTSWVATVIDADHFSVPYNAAARSISITASTAANPTRLTSAAHAMASGAAITISGATGVWAGLDAPWTATVIDADHFSVPLNSAPGSISITAATAANPTVLTSVGHGLSTGASLPISGATGLWAGLNATWTVTVIDADHFSVPFNALGGGGSTGLTTTGVQVPASYNSFTPPAAGSTYVDSVFGSTVKRITDAPVTADTDIGGLLTWIGTEYATMSAFNSDNSLFVLVHESYFGLYSTATGYIADLDHEINASAQPRWSRANNHTLYYIHVNQLKMYDTTTGAKTVIHTFTEYAQIDGRGESDISIDGDHMIFAGSSISTTDNRWVFIFTISTLTKSAVFDTAGNAYDSLYITPNNNFTITWGTSGTARFTGIEFFDGGSMTFQRQVTRAGGHMDVCLDGTDEVLVWTNSNDPTPLAGTNNAFVKVRLSDGLQTGLQNLDFSMAVHVSAPDSAGYVYAETYVPANPASPPTGWFAYSNELLRIKLDGSETLRFAHHRSRPHGLNTYNWQPKMTCSRDGSIVIFSSDFDLQTISGLPDQYIDVYMIQSPGGGGSSLGALAGTVIGSLSGPGALTGTVAGALAGPGALAGTVIGTV